MSEPVIPAQTNLPEFTPLVFVLAIILSVVMAISNVYLGLKVGMTVSASIPSAVLSMIIFRKIRNSNILQNNLVQTAASAGESLAAGFIFTLPALLLLGYWEEVNYVSSVIMCVLGGMLGVVFSIPLRHLFILEEKLTFPEGVATAKILIAGSEKTSSKNEIVALIAGGILGAVMKIGEAVFRMWHEALEFGTVFGSGWLFYCGTYFSPALIGVGYIVGPGVALAVFLGGVISWGFALPIMTAFGFVSPPPAPPREQAYWVWSHHVRFLGVGAMLIGGLWTLFSLRKALASGAAKGYRRITSIVARSGESETTELRTERDIKLSSLVTLLLIVGLGILLVLWRTSGGFEYSIGILIFVLCALCGVSF